MSRAFTASDRNFSSFQPAPRLRACPNPIILGRCPRRLVALCMQPYVPELMGDDGICLAFSIGRPGHVEEDYRDGPHFCVGVGVHVHGVRLNELLYERLACEQAAEDGRNSVSSGSINSSAFHFASGGGSAAANSSGNKAKAANTN